MKRETMDRMIGKRVTIRFEDGDERTGILGYTPEFSAKFGWRKAGYYTLGNLDFKASNVKRVREEKEWLTLT